jgi:hypothetical protein
LPCPICEKRKPARYCPAKGESICAVCCGTGREVTIDCLADCSYLLAAHRYEDTHPRPVSPDMPFVDVDVRGDLHLTNAQFVASILHNVAHFCVSHPEIRDSEVLMAIQALAETYKTLAAGIYYERPPESRLAGDLYAFLQEFLGKIKGEAAKGTSHFSSPKDGEIFQLLVLLYRHAYFRTNGRPHSRRFIEFLRQQFPESPELKQPESRIIVP